MSTLETLEIATGNDPDAAVVWLHGLGADGNDFVPVVPELRLPAQLKVRFVFPHAPMMPVTVNSGYVMRAWYDITFDGLERRPDAQGILASQGAVEALLAREQARGIAPGRIVLAGFSQGGAITLQTGLRYQERLAGLLVLSSYLPLADTLAAQAASANANTPIFMAHGVDDNVIPLQLAQRSHRQLEALGYGVEWHQYSMPHSVCAQEIADISHWLQQVLP
jgi:phospholipase/carboxylesterase